MPKEVVYYANLISSQVSFYLLIPQSSQVLRSLPTLTLSRIITFLFYDIAAFKIIVTYFLLQRDISTSLCGDVTRMLLLPFVPPLPSMSRAPEKQ